MTGIEPPDREQDQGHDQELDQDQDRRTAVGQARPMSRPALLAAVVAVCGTGLLAGLGLFAGSTAKPRPPAPAPVVLKAADTLGPRAGDPVRERPAHRLHPRHLPRHVPQHVSHSLHAVHEAAHGATRRTHETYPVYETHKGSAGSGAPHGAGRHSPVREGIKPSARPATERPAAPSGTPRTAPRPTSAATGPAGSR